MNRDGDCGPPGGIPISSEVSYRRWLSSMIMSGMIMRGDLIGHRGKWRRSCAELARLVHGQDARATRRAVDLPFGRSFTSDAVSPGGFC
jgi:hypothetical protein